MLNSMQGRHLYRKQFRSTWGWGMSSIQKPRQPRRLAIHGTESSNGTTVGSRHRRRREGCRVRRSVHSFAKECCCIWQACSIEVASVAMARSLRSLARFAGVFRQQNPQLHAAPLASSSPSPFFFSAGRRAAVAQHGASLRFMSDDHTAKWMQNTDKKSPMELINEVPPIKVDARVVACEGGTDPALGHPLEYISLDAPEPAVCKYCGLRYYQGDAHGHH